MAAAAQQNSVKAMKQGVRQCTNEVLMIAPTAFGFNDQTAQDNSFMHASMEGGSTEAGSDVTQHVLTEFSGLYRELTEVSTDLSRHLMQPSPVCCKPCDDHITVDQLELAVLNVTA